MPENQDRAHPSLCPGCSRQHMEFRYEIKTARSSQRVPNDNGKIMVVEISCPDCGHIFSVVPYAGCDYDKIRCPHE